MFCITRKLGVPTQLDRQKSPPNIWKIGLENCSLNLFQSSNIGSSWCSWSLLSLNFWFSGKYLFLFWKYILKPFKSVPDFLGNICSYFGNIYFFRDFHDFQLSSSSGEGLSINIDSVQEELESWKSRQILISWKSWKSRKILIVLLQRNWKVENRWKSRKVLIVFERNWKVQNLGKYW